MKKAAKAPISRALEARGIYRLQNGPEDFPTFNNSVEAVDAFFSDKNKVREYLTRGRIEFYDEIASAVRTRFPTTGRTVADVGCGTGHLLACFDDAAARAGYDFSAEAVRVAARACPTGSFKQHDIYGPPPGRYDLVLCCETLEHMFHPRKALQSLRLMVGDGGSFFLTIPNGRRDTTLGHINFWSPESWRVFLEETLPGDDIETGMLAGNRNLFAFLPPH
jgi:SAM-dependent methyltransferase